MRAGIFGPILRWEMTTVVRRRRYYWLRAVYGVVLTFVLWMTYQSAFWRYGYDGAVEIERFTVFASEFFSSFGFTQLCAVLLLTPAYVGTAIAVEKERKTFEYVFVTDLANREIVLGKWAARTLNVLMLVLAGIPIVSFAGLFGGIDFGQLLVLAVLTISCVFATSALAILVSVYTQSVRQALVSAYGVLFLLLIAPLLYHACIVLAAYCAWEAGLGPFGPRWDTLLERFEEILLASNPVSAYWALMFEYSGRTSVAKSITTMTIVHGTLTLFCLALAIWRVRRYYQKRIAGPGAKLFAALRNRRWRRVPPVSERPMIWKELYFDRPQRSGCVVTGGATLAFSLLILWTFWYISQNGTRAEELNMFLRIFGTVIVGLVYLMVAVRAASSIGLERDHDCWVSLLSTPLTGREIIAAKLVGAIKPLFGLATLALPVYALAVYLDALALLAIPAVLLAIAVYGVFVAALGLFHAMRCRTTGGAIGATIATASIFFGLGHLIGTFFFAMVSFAIQRSGVDDDLLFGLYFASLPWFVIACAPFRWEDLNQVNDAEGVALIVGAIFFLTVFAGAAVLLYASTVAQFTRWTGRSDAEERPGASASLVVTRRANPGGD